MPKLTIDNTEINIPQRNRAEHKDILNEINQYRAKHKEDANLDDGAIANYLSMEERDKKIAELNSVSDENDQMDFDKTVKDLTETVKQEQKQNYINKTNENAKEKVANLKEEFKKENDKDFDEIKYSFIDEALGKENYVKSALQNGQSYSQILGDTIEKLHNDLEKQDNEKTQEKLDIVQGMKKLWFDLNDVERQRKKAVTNEDLLNVKFADVTDIVKNDDRYKDAQTDLQNTMEKHHRENKMQVGDDLENSKYVAFIKQKQQDDKEFKNAVAKRDELKRAYEKTSLLSRIARWILPNSWSEAGRIQDQIDALDNAIEDAGYSKAEVDDASAHLARAAKLNNANKKQEKTANNKEIEFNNNKDLQNSIEGDTINNNEIQIGQKENTQPEKELTLTEEQKQAFKNVYEKLAESLSASPSSFPLAKIMMNNAKKLSEGTLYTDKGINLLDSMIKKSNNMLDNGDFELDDTDIQLTQEMKPKVKEAVTLAKNTAEQVSTELTTGEPIKEEQQKGIE